MALVTYGTAADHLRLNGFAQEVWDTDLQLKIEHASNIVLSFLKLPTDSGWNEFTDPETDPAFALAQQATLHVLGNLYRFRGDDESEPSPLDDTVTRVLYMRRVPTLA